MAIFKVKKPEYTTWQWVKSIGLRVIFPPVLLWDLLKLAVNKLVGEAVGEVVLPAQGMDFPEFDNVRLFNTDELTHVSHTIETHDSAKLDTLEIIHQSQQHLEKQYQSYIINFGGNAMVFEQMCSEMQDDASTLKSNVIGFNYRGVGESKGIPRSKDDLVTDGIAQVQRLLDQGVSPENITLKGLSLGAGIASLVALHFHTHAKPINLFNGRSFSSISNNVVGWIRTASNPTGHKETFGWKLLGWIAMPFIKLGVALSNWEINAGEAYKAIPETHKDYILVRSRKSNRGDSTIDDPVIPHYASLHKFLKSERKAKKEKIDRLIKALIKAADNDFTIFFDVVSLTTERDKFNERKMETNPFKNGHCVDMDKMKNRSDKTALTFFREFVQRTHDHHAVAPKQQ